METHEVLQTKAGKTMWLNEYLPIVEIRKKHVTEVLLWMFHTFGLCSLIN